MDLLHECLLEAGLGDIPVDVVVLDKDAAAEARAFSGSPSFASTMSTSFPRFQAVLPAGSTVSTDGRLQGLPDRELLVDRLRGVSRG